eukprot:5043654-Pyramimonas_sp.AAC.4
MDRDSYGDLGAPATAIPASHHSCVLTHAAPRIAVRPLPAHAGLGSATPVKDTIGSENELVARTPTPRPRSGRVFLCGRNFDTQTAG